jgi:hypothetical protein
MLMPQHKLSPPDCSVATTCAVNSSVGHSPPRSRVRILAPTTSSIAISTSRLAARRSGFPWRRASHFNSIAGDRTIATGGFCSGEHMPAPVSWGEVLGDNTVAAAVHEDGSPIRPEWYSDEFQRLRQRAGLRRTLRLTRGPPKLAWDTVGTLVKILAEHPKQKTHSDTGRSGFFVVGLTGFEPATT